ncbi:tetratricopeptide repeat protein [Streptomyces avicenniae]|uniref:tetratricopeptide repeat protein n=1 Tax=Streptomyces avicenniae TaxID=500153 RepID=UPI00069C207C|nr:tetratricopeptide repeat protein [Streptomyces avicenniae]
MDRAVERAEALMSLRRYEEARDLLARHVAEAPDDAVAWTELARCHSHVSSPREGVAATGEALRLDPANLNALVLHGTLLQRSGAGLEKAMEPLREAVRIRPDFWGGWSVLADYTFRHSMLQVARSGGLSVLTHQDVAPVAAEAAGMADEAIRLAPEEVRPYEVRQSIAELSGDTATAEAMDRAILRLDPTHADALSRQTRRMTNAPGVRASQAADVIADGLGAAPDSPEMRSALDAATYRLLRGTRWLALLCLAFTGVALGVGPGDEGTVPELPLSLGQRVWDVCVFAAIWAVGALLRYRRRRKGVRLNVRSLLRRDGWARLAAGQAVAVTVCAVVTVLIPWSEPDVPRVIFWTVLVATLLTMYLDRPRLRESFRTARRRG